MSILRTYRLQLYREGRAEKEEPNNDCPDIPCNDRPPDDVRSSKDMYSWPPQPAPCVRGCAPRARILARRVLAYSLVSPCCAPHAKCACTHVARSPLPVARRYLPATPLRAPLEQLLLLLLLAMRLESASAGQ